NRLRANRRLSPQRDKHSQARSLGRARCAHRQSDERRSLPGPVVRGFREGRIGQSGGQGPKERPRRSTCVKTGYWTEELGPQQGPTEGTGDWSSEEPEEEQEETGAGPAGYSYQPLNQDPEQEEVELAPVGDGEDVVADIQDRIQALGLHLPDPPLESEGEDEEGATALSNHSSIPMDPEHVELVKRTMAGVSLPAPGVPAWAQEISDAQWEDVVQKALQARQASPVWK
uniref:Male-enhanced antigen 1 n=1 Tax=Equus caballus TaxID=9796 RepID=A0A9L0RS35_HORSE